MASTRITPINDVTGTSIDLSTIDVERALQRGRRLRSQAFTSVLKALFTHSSDERSQQADRRERFSPGCTAAA